MTHRDSPDRWRWPVHGHRTRIIVALLGLTLSMGVPVAALGGGPVPTVDGQPVGRLADPAGLGITGTLPGDPLPGDSVPGAGAPLAGAATDAPAGDLAGAGQQPGIPTPPNLPDGPLGIPGAVLDSYQFAQRTLAAIRPGCHLSWAVLAGIGRIESNHASDGRVDAFGTTLGPILGPRLDGSPGMAAIPDTDRGQLDRDTVWDRAVGPMQFIPSSWRSYGVDGNGDGVANPNNIYDATITTGLYLCAGGSDLSDPAQLQAAVFRYNHSSTYVDIVLRWAQAYLTGVVPIPSAPGPVPPGINGNGGRSIATDAAPVAAAAAAAAALVSLPAGPAPAAPSSSPPAPSVTLTSPPVTTTPPAVTTTPPPSLTTTAPLPPSLTTTSPPSLTTTPSPSLTTTDPPQPSLTTTDTPPPSLTTTDAPATTAPFLSLN